MQRRIVYEVAPSRTPIRGTAGHLGHPRMALGDVLSGAGDGGMPFVVTVRLRGLDGYRRGRIGLCSASMGTGVTPLQSIGRT